MREGVAMRSHNSSMVLLSVIFLSAGATLTGCGGSDGSPRTEDSARP